MPIDPRIALGYQPTQVDGNLNQLAQVLKVQDLQQNQVLNRLKVDEYQRGITDNNALRSALSAPDADPYKALLGLGRVKEATDFAKGQADLKKSQAEADSKGVDMAHKRIDSWGQAMGFVRQNPTPENAMAAVQHLVTMGIMPPEKAQAAVASLAQNPTPQNIAQWADMGFRTALGAKEQLPKLETKNIGGQTITQQIDPLSGRTATVNALQNTQTPDNAASNARMAADAAAGRAVSIRGQDVSAATSMRGQNLANERARESNDSGRIPAGYRRTAEGGLEFIPGGPADPNAAKRAAPTEFQGKAAMFGTRAQEADRILSGLEGSYSPAGINTKQALGRTPVIGGALEAAGNVALSNSSQKAEQAQRDFVNAVLRLESGAAISESEFDNARKQYFPEPGDSKEKIAQKAANRKTTIQGLINNARPGSVDTSPKSGLPPDIAAILKKHGGK